MRIKSFQHSKKSVKGVSLIEVLVSVLILAIGLMGIAAMQATALSNSQSSLERSQAVIHTYSIMEAMRANVTAARANAYSPANDSGWICAAPAGGSLVADDINTWITDITTSNQTGCGRIERVLPLANNEFRISVRWNDSRGLGGNAAQSLTTVSRL